MRPALLLAVVTGCSLYNSGGSAPDALVSHSEEEWVHQVMPMLEAQCGVCHSGTMPGAIGFLDGSTPDQVRTTLLTFQPPVIDLEDPASSRIVLKGAHEGPTITSDEQAILVNWLVGN